MKLTLESIRERFPNPRKCEGQGAKGYCVAGAFTLATASKDCDIQNFPCSFHFEKTLRRFNERLTPEEAQRAARRITALNDDGDFETAWAKLGEALNWSGK